MLHAVRTKSSVAQNVQVAVLIPCCNEALSIAAVVADFQRALPGTPIHVYDNNSADRHRRPRRASRRTRRL